MLRSFLFVLPSFLVLSSLSYAQESLTVNGRLLPSREAASVTFIPQNLNDISLLNVLPHGAEVKQGQKVATADFKVLDEQIEETERSVKACTVAAERMKFELDQLKASSDDEIRAAKMALQWSKENLKDFVEKQKVRLLAEEDERVARANRSLFYKEEELKQLSKMYNDDQVAEETEQIILTRIKNDLSDAKFAVEGAALTAELAKTRNIVRMEEKLKADIQTNTLKLNSVEGKALFDIEQKQMELTSAEVALDKVKNKWEELKSDRKQAELLSPADGILIYGGYVGDKWDVTTAPKLRPGGKLLPYDKVGTIVPRDASLVVVATWPDALNTPQKGEEVSIYFRKDSAEGALIPMGKEGKGVVESIDEIPGVDGSRSVTILPKEKFFAPGAKVVVSVSKKQ